MVLLVKLISHILGKTSDNIVAFISYAQAYPDKHVRYLNAAYPAAMCFH